MLHHHGGARVMLWRQFQYIETSAIADDSMHFLSRYHPVVMWCSQQCPLVSVTAKYALGLPLHSAELRGAFFDEGTHAFTKIVLGETLCHPIIGLTHGFGQRHVQVAVNLRFHYL